MASKPLRDHEILFVKKGSATYVGDFSCSENAYGLGVVIWVRMVETGDTIAWCEA